MLKLQKAVIQKIFCSSSSNLYFLQEDSDAFKLEKSRKKSQRGDLKNGQGFKVITKTHFMQDKHSGLKEVTFKKPEKFKTHQKKDTFSKTKRFD